MSDTALRARPAEFAPPAVVDRMRARALSVGVLFAVIAAVLAYNNRVLFLRAWLFSFMFWLGLTLGPLVLIMLQYASGGHWGRLGRRFWEAATRAIPLMFLFWLPLAFGMNYLFPWTHMSPDVLGASKAKYYLNPNWFVIRGVFYFVGWGFLAWRMNRWSRREEAGETNAAQFVAIQGLSGAGIVFYGLTITFAAIDWVMSLNPLWWSTVWGMLFMVGQVLSTFAFTIWLLARLSPVEPISKVFKTEYLHDFGKLMFAFVVLWAYLSFSQWLIIWSGNIVEEIHWYLDRIQQHWQYFAIGLILFHFVLPFALLLSRSLKRNMRRLVLIALLVLFMRLVDLFWLIVPNFHSEGAVAPLSWGDMVYYVVVLVAMGGLWLAHFYWQLSKRPLMPVNDPHFAEMLETEHHG